MNKLVVIKIGTMLLTGDEGKIKLSFLGRVCEEISAVKYAGWSVILVSSGAMASGAGVLKDSPHTIVERSAFSCVGQPLLMEYYRNFFSVSGIVVAQALLTWRDFEDKAARVLVKKNMGKLIENGVLPIVNENDLTATEELSFGDNDQLAAKVAVLFAANKLVVLSDTDGLYDKNPHKYSDAKYFETVKKITDEIEGCVGEKVSKNSLGGMKTKLEAAKYATGNGVETIIASGIPARDTIQRIVLKDENIGTKFLV